MNDLAKQWVQDLLTTDAPQTQGALHNDEGFCCLGRACVVAGLIPERTPGDGTRKYDSCTVMLPLELYQALGLRDESGGFELSSCTPEWQEQISECDCLTHLNDHLEWSFEKIGRFIQENEEAVFQ